MFLLKKKISNPTCEECFLGTHLLRMVFPQKNHFYLQLATSLWPNAGLASRLWLRRWRLHHGRMYHSAQKSFAILNDFGLEILRRHPSRGNIEVIILSPKNRTSGDVNYGDSKYLLTRCV